MGSRSSKIGTSFERQVDYSNANNRHSLRTKKKYGDWAVLGKAVNSVNHLRSLQTLFEAVSFAPQDTSKWEQLTVRWSCWRIPSQGWGPRVNLAMPWQLSKWSELLESRCKRMLDVDIWKYPEWRKSKAGMRGRRGGFQVPVNLEWRSTTCMYILS